MNYKAAEQYILEELRLHLSPTLYYHGVHHTLDVIQAARQLAAQEGVEDVTALLLLDTAACFHDAGFLHTYRDHEEVGCQIVREVLPGYGYLPTQIDIICDMIMATKIPQTPGSHLAQILCDADLDYLGRDDFEPIAESLFHELLARDMITDKLAWDQMQIRFLENHHYWTVTAKAIRQPAKQQHLTELQTLVKAETNRTI